MRPKTKCEVRWEDKSSNPVDAGASTSNKPKIRVLNHKDYKTWKVSIESIYAYSSITTFFNHCWYFQKMQPSLNAFLLMILPNKCHALRRKQDIKLHIFSIASVSAYRFIVGDLNTNAPGGHRYKSYPLTARLLKDS